MPKSTGNLTALTSLDVSDNPIEEEEEEDELEEEDEGGDVAILDEDALNEMSLGELRELAKVIGIAVKVPSMIKTDDGRRRVYVNAIRASAEE